MKFKVVGKSLILTDTSVKITKGENDFEEMEIVLPRYHGKVDNSLLSYRFTEISEDGTKTAVQVITMDNYDSENVYLNGTITSSFSAIAGKVYFMLTGINDEKIVAKYQSAAFSVNDDLTLTALPNETAAEQIFNQTQLEVQKAIEAAERAEKASKIPAPAQIYPATEIQLGGIKSGKDISVSEEGIVTVNSVNGKMLGKSVPADAVFTDTVYTLPKATTEILGGIKVDGKTITANEDGTISASRAISEMQNLAAQIAYPNNYLIYDDAGKPSVMVAIPKFYLDEVIDGASHTVHPAFIINGIEQDVIYISKYQNTVENNRAYSLPMTSPYTNVTFDQANDYCKAKGEGWHLMTNAEWAAIALWCKKNSTMPKGNNNYGKDVSEINLPQKAVTCYYQNGKNATVLTGSGRESWYHDGTFAGITDLNGNVYEWCSGVRLVDGEIQILTNNDAADKNNLCTTDSNAWKAILQDGSPVAPGTIGTLKIDYTTNAPVSNTELFQFSTVVEHKQTTDTPIGRKIFAAISSNNNINIPNILKTLALFPADADGYEDDCFWFKNNGERLLVRGGDFNGGIYDGVFNLRLSNSRTYSEQFLGFRCAYYKK